MDVKMLVLGTLLAYYERLLVYCKHVHCIPKYAYNFNRKYVSMLVLLFITAPIHKDINYIIFGIF